jgi:hypothetical protein
MVPYQKPTWAVATYPLLVQCIDQDRRLEFPVKKAGAREILKYAHTKGGIFVKRDTKGSHPVSIVSHDGNFGCLVTTKNACKTFYNEGTCGNSSCDFYHAHPGTVMAGPVGSEHGNIIVSPFTALWRASNTRISQDLLDWSPLQKAELSAMFENKLNAIREERRQRSGANAELEARQKLLQEALTEPAPAPAQLQAPLVAAQAPEPAPRSHTRSRSRSRSRRKRAKRDRSRDRDRNRDRDRSRARDRSRDRNRKRRNTKKNIKREPSSSPYRSSSRSTLGSGSM